ncbi:Major facilitator superfamily [Rubellimicrobium mesophilum DSM 19309]|uniref:Major facilitator superfamily n=1 Tax=Rubellimicrobium mesophilum DSM 19309 TaxID=442562 RepID=A0A017HKS4_9RHOB|nr:MFS transporter [Rubellimicrobium mesophilum]EYD74773.1 Major facilitator superfamily [Rubellimicrobium mesophilum DSM 19309]
MTAINPETLTSFPAPEEDRPAWGAVVAMTLCSFVLIASEFMPVSLLTPIARDLGLTEGQAGQAISISGLFAVVTSLLVTALIGRLDRRLVLIGMALLLAVSGTVVAFAPDFLVLMTGRALLGVAIGGFWSLNTAVLMRLLPMALVPLGLAVNQGGTALAGAVAAPLGSYMGDLIGWRGAFFSVVPLALAAAALQALALPPLPARQPGAGGSVLRLLGNGAVALGMTAILLVFMGQFALSTYLRPFLEQVTGVDVPTLSLLLLVIGATGLLGLLLVGRVLRAGLVLSLVGVPAVMAGAATALAFWESSTWAVAVLLAVWGLVATAPPVAWGTWLARILPGDAEAGGGLMVAVIQLAITFGAMAGGLALDGQGPVAPALAGAALLALAAGAALLAGRALHPAS